MRYNNELQIIDNQNKAYLLGLFYADGNISKNQHHTRLGLVDKDLILKLKNKFQFFNYYIQERSNIQNLYYLQSGLKLVREHFILNGCFPAKSFENKNNLLLPFSNSLTRHFIRGYFDGDGGCTLTKGKTKQQKRVYIYSNSNVFLQSLKEFLKLNNIQATIILAKSVYKLTISSSSYRDFYNFLYLDSEIFLKRKRLIFRDILNTKFFIQRESPDCQFCNSNNTVYNGSYTYKGIRKPRVLCKDCNKNFTIQTAPNSSNIISGEDELLES